MQDLVAFLGELNSAGGNLYLEKQAIDTTTSSGRMLFQMLGVFAEFERALIQERIHAGLVRAREKGTRSGEPIGRPRIPHSKVEQICAELAKGTGIIRTARIVGVGVGTVHKIKRLREST